MKPERITNFRGRYAFLSNFYVESDGRTLEHRFQAAKTHIPAEKNRILNAQTPSKAKYYGRICTLRPDWEDIKIDVMYHLVKAKFSHPDLAAVLLDTGEAYLEEGTWWGDKFWGVDSRTGEGENHLGAILMRVRSELARADHNLIGTH